MKNITLKILSVLLLTFIFTGCIIVKHDAQSEDVAPEVSLSPKPNIAMSDKLVRSAKGDMIAFIPEGWFFIDVAQDVSPDIINVAVNSEYNLSLVFSVLRINEAMTNLLQNEGLLGLARMSFNKRNRKSGGTVEHTGQYRNITMGSQVFAKYEYTTTGGALVARSAVFISSLGQYYEVSLIPLDDVTMNPIPQASELDKIFHSILATVKY